MGILGRFLGTQAAASTVLIRLIVGGMYLVDGIQAFLCADNLWVKSFAAIPIPYHEIAVPVIGSCEIGCGTLLIVGLLTRLAATTSVIMNVAVSVMLVLSVPVHQFGMFSLRPGDPNSVWSIIQDARVDFALILGGLFLAIVGAGSLSVDALLARWCFSWEEKHSLTKPRAWAGTDLGTWL